MKIRLALIGILSLVLLLVSNCSLPKQPDNGMAGSGTITSPLPSSGCGKPAPFAPGLSKNETIISGRYERLYRIHLPSGYHSSTPQPLVLNFHGHGSTAATQEKLTKLSLLANQQDFIAVYPQGMIGPDHQSGWATGPVWDPHVNDVLFVSDLLNSLQTRLCIDPLRIYAMGFSNGGGMTNVLACTLAGRLAAFAPVSGSYPAYPGGCHPVRPVSLLEFHGTADRIVPYNGSQSRQLPSILAWLQGWATRDGCTMGPTIFYTQGNVSGLEWKDCRASATVVHFRLQG